MYLIIGPMQGIVVFNDLVVGGVLFGMLGGFIKYVIERSKIAEIRNKVWGRSVERKSSLIYILPPVFVLPMFCECFVHVLCVFLLISY